MNLPSLQKYVDAVVPGGQIYVDSTLIAEKVARTDLEVFYIPATAMAHDAGVPTLANMVMMGHVLQHKDVYKRQGPRQGGHRGAEKRNSDLRQAAHRPLQVSPDRRV